MYLIVLLRNIGFGYLIKDASYNIFIWEIVSLTKDNDQITLTIWGYKAIHPHIKPFCIELGEPHGDTEVVKYKEKNKHGFKSIKCLKCGRLLLINGELVKQRSVPDYVATEFDLHGYDYLKKRVTNIIRYKE